LGDNVTRQLPTWFHVVSRYGIYGTLLPRHHHGKHRYKWAWI